MEPFLLLLGFLFNLPAGWFAYRKQALTFPGGFITAGLVGYTLFIIQPIFWILLLVFFSSSTLLTKFKEENHIKVEALSLAEKVASGIVSRFLPMPVYPCFWHF